jgi:hypothetical protein
MPAEHRLRHVERVGGARQAALLGDLDKKQPFGIEDRLHNVNNIALSPRLGDGARHA